MILGIIVFIMFYLMFGKMASLGMESIFEDIGDGIPEWLSIVIIIVWPLTIPIFVVALLVSFIMIIFD
jgi:hypothetical protein